MVGRESEDEDRRTPAGRLGSTASIVILLVALLTMPASAAEPGSPGALSAEQLELEQLYAKHCASCHDEAKGRTPGRTALLFVTPRIISRALSEGSMKPMAADLSAEQIRRLASHLSALPDRPPQSPPARCATAMATASDRPAPVDGDDWPTTGRDVTNTRFQARPGLRAEDVPRLELLWALGIPGGASGSPVLEAGRLYVSSGGGEILALDAREGCLVWRFEHGRIVRTLTVGASRAAGGGRSVFFADDMGMAYALDAASGALRWATTVETHPLNRATAAPTVHGGRVFVPMSSIEDPLTHDPGHSCCSSRGSVTALDAETGKLLWKQYTVAKSPREISPASAGTPARLSPAGGSIYTPVTVDARRGLVYASTAEAYTDEDAKGAYSVLALDVETGERIWERQFLPDPADRASVCRELGNTDCRNVFSMGTAVTLHAAGDGQEGGDLLFVGQKWGIVYALDPDRKGEIVWQRRVARGGDMGGIMYGLADDGRAIYVPVSDLDAPPPGRPGDLVALEPSTGTVLWRARQPEPVCSWGEGESCVGAQSAAPTVIPGVVFASAWDGFVRAHASSDGERIWEFDTGREFEAINGQARGGQIAAYPIQVVDGLVYVTSGASSQARPGNALLVFGLAK